MTSKAEVRQMLDDLFTEEALILGGLAAFYQPEDDFIWRLVKNLDALRTRFLRRIDGISARADAVFSRRPNLKPHPAIQEFLGKLRR